MKTSYLSKRKINENILRNDPNKKKKIRVLRTQISYKQHNRSVHSAYLKILIKVMVKQCLLWRIQCICPALSSGFLACWLAKTWISQVILLSHIRSDEIQGRSRRPSNIGWTKCLNPTGSNSLTDHIGIEQARDGWYQNITLGTYIEVNNLFIFKAFRIQECCLLSAGIMLSYNIPYKKKCQTSSQIKDYDVNDNGVSS